jgi:hypothetical protein
MNGQALLADSAVLLMQTVDALHNSTFDLAGKAVENLAGAMDQLRKAARLLHGVPLQNDLDEDTFGDDFHPPFSCHHIADAPGTPLPQDIRRHHASQGMMGLIVPSHVETWAGHGTDRSIEQLSSFRHSHGRLHHSAL